MSRAPCVSHFGITRTPFRKSISASQLCDRASHQEARRAHSLGLYLTIVHALGAKPRAQNADLIAQTQTLLAAEEHERRRRVVFNIDEAHLLAPEQLEELRLLTNAEMDSQSPFALLLVGHRRSRVNCALASSPRSISASPRVTNSRQWTWPRRRNFSAITPGARRSYRSAVCR